MHDCILIVFNVRERKLRHEPMVNVVNFPRTIYISFTIADYTTLSMTNNKEDPF